MSAAFASHRDPNSLNHLYLPFFNIFQYFSYLWLWKVAHLKLDDCPSYAPPFSSGTLIMFDTAMGSWQLAEWQREEDDEKHH
jgi:hypothetical protein